MTVQVSDRLGPWFNTPVPDGNAQPATLDKSEAAGGWDFDARVYALGPRKEDTHSAASFGITGTYRVLVRAKSAELVVFLFDAYRNRLRARRNEGGDVHATLQSRLDLSFRLTDPDTNTTKKLIDETVWLNDVGDIEVGHHAHVVELMPKIYYADYSIEGRSAVWGQDDRPVMTGIFLEQITVAVRESRGLAKERAKPKRRKSVPLEGFDLKY